MNIESLYVWKKGFPMQRSIANKKEILNQHPSHKDQKKTKKNKT
jgi:hypothetical protein